MAESTLTSGDLQTVGDFQGLVDRIQAILVSDSDASQEVMTEIAKSYSTAVNLVNVRLRGCEELLQKGFRTECIHKCEVEPKLLDLVSILSFAEAPQWLDYVKQFSLPSPPELKDSIARELNEAYSTAQPLEALMMDHRRHALARSSLRTRIDVMRRIAKLDVGNPIWQDDLKTFEETRHRQLQDEYVALVGQNDLSGLQLLEKELSSNAWIVPPKKDLVKKVADAAAKLRAQESRKTLETLGPQLVATYAEFNLTRGRELRKDWETANQFARLTDGDVLYESVKPTLEWLRQQDALEQEQADHQAAIAALSQALDQSRGRDTLVKLYHEVQRLDRGIPPDVEQRFHDRLAQIDKEAVRRGRIKLVTLVVSILGVSALVGYSVFAWRGARERQAHAANLEILLNEKRLAEAGKYFKDLEQTSPTVHQSPQIQGLFNAWQSAVQQDDGRRNKFAERLASARRLGLEQPSWDNFPLAFEEVKAANEIAVTDDEQTEITRVARDISAKKDEMQTAVDEKFRQELAALQARLDKLPADDMPAAEQLLADAEGLRSRKEAAAALHQDLQRLLSSINRKSQQMVVASLEAKQMVAITQEVGNRIKYRGLLEAFARDGQFATSDRAKQFQRVVTDEAALWQGFERWNQFLDRWTSRNVAEMTPADTMLWLNEAKPLVAEHGNFPWAEKVNRINAHLQAVAQRPGILAALDVVLRKDVVTKLYMLQSEDGGKNLKRYYSLEVPRKTQDRYQIKYLTSTQLNEGPKTAVIDGIKETIVGKKLPNGEYDWTTPQSRFSRTAQDALDKVTGSRWETTFLDLLSTLFNDRTMDSVLKLQLMQAMMTNGNRGSSILGDLLQKHSQQIAKANINPESNWINPDDADGKKDRDAADSVLRKLDDPAKFKAAVDESMNEFKKLTFAPRFAWVGWVHRDSGRAWACSTKVPPSEGDAGELYILLDAGPGQPLKFEKVGQLNKGKVTLNVLSETIFLEGRPVYKLVTK